MFRHNLLISYRSFLRFRGTFLINLIGLASGLASTLLIYLWVMDEAAIDKFHEHDSKLYQVMRNQALNDGGTQTTASMPGRLADELMASFPEVEAATSIWPSGYFGSEGYLTYQDQNYNSLTQLVNNEFFKMMSFPLLEGNPETVLKDKSEVLISSALANKVFGTTQNLLGTTLRWNKGRINGDFIISGIFKEIPTNSSMKFDMLLSAELMMDAYTYHEHWGNTNPHTLVLLKQGANADDFNAKIEGLIQTKVSKSSSTLFIQKFSDRYLYGSYENGQISGGRIFYVRLFSFVAIIILVIACINFMNLFTARATARLKEIGIKKSIGAKRGTLISQYYTESFLLTGISMVLSLALVALLLPQFNQVTGKEFSIQFTIELITGMGLIVFVTGFISGSYPAFYLSKLKTIESLNGRLFRKFSDLLIRKGLVVFQFCISTVLIFSVMIISNQMEYIQSKNLGYQRDNVLKFTNAGIQESAFQAFANSLENVPGVVSIASTSHDLTGDHGKTSNLSWPGKTADQKVNFLNLEMSPGFIETMGIELVMGRSFDKDRPNETQKIIFNEMAIEQMGLKNPIGKTIKLWGNQDKEIIGVVKDFHSESLYEDIQPTFIQAFPDGSHTIIKIQPSRLASTLTEIEQRYKEVSNGLPIDIHFLDSEYQSMYQSEKKISSLSRFFTLIAGIISCLGLLGLTAFTAERRTKEIGIRKVLGSGRWRIVQMFIVNFTKMILAALIIGLPISYFLAKSWLQNFKFSIDLKPEYFLVCSIVIIAVAWLTVSFQTLRAANTNPVKSLRSE